MNKHKFMTYSVRYQTVNYDGLHYVDILAEKLYKGEFLCPITVYPYNRQGHYHELTRMLSIQHDLYPETNTRDILYFDVGNQKVIEVLNSHMDQFYGAHHRQLCNVSFLHLVGCTSLSGPGYTIKSVTDVANGWTLPWVVSNTGAFGDLNGVRAWIRDNGYEVIQYNEQK